MVIALNSTPDDGQEQARAPRKPGVAQVRQIAQAGLDKIRLTKSRRGEDPEIGDPVVAHAPDGSPFEVRPGKWTKNALGLPREHECPVQVLGKDGDGLWVIDVDGELRFVASTPFGQSTIQSLFGNRQRWLYWAFPRLKKEGKDEDGNQLFSVETWKPEKLREAFWWAASEKGTWRPEDRIRGRGAWRDADGRLVVHCGDRLFVGGAYRPVGEIDRTFYVSADAIAGPWHDPVDDDNNPAPALLAAFGAFNWRRPKVDPFLALGLLCSMLLNAALAWRSHGFVDGPSGSGKSTFLALFREVLGPLSIYSTDASPASIRAAMGYEARPVILDEVEAHLGDRARDLISLARNSSFDEGKAMRSSAEQKVREFALRSSWMMGAINRPVMAQEDFNRFILLTLRPLDPKIHKEKPHIGETADTIGPRLLRRIADRWDEVPRFIAAYKEMLVEAGHESRGGDTWGVPMALAHLVLGDAAMDEAGFPFEDLRGWAPLVGREAVAREGDEIGNWRGAIRHLFGARIDVWKSGATTTVGRLIDGMRETGPDTTIISEVKRQLADVGLGLRAKGAPAKGEAERPGWKEGCEGWWLGVPNEGDQLWRLYEGTNWGSKVRGKGGWGDAMRQAPEALGLISADKGINRMRINGEQMRCTMIDLDRWWKLLEDEENEG